MATVHQLFPETFNEAEMAQLDEISRAIGRLEQSVEEIKNQLKAGATRFGDHDDRMAALEAAENRRAGGWAVVFAASSVIGAIVGWFMGMVGK